jgi:hypothetical protein
VLVFGGLFPYVVEWAKGLPAAVFGGLEPAHPSRVLNHLIHTQVADFFSNYHQKCGVSPYSFATTIILDGFGRLLISQIRQTSTPTRAIISTFDAPILST